MCQYYLGYVYRCNFKSIHGCFELRWHMDSIRESGRCHCDNIGRVYLSAGGAFKKPCYKCVGFAELDAQGIQRADSRAVLPYEIRSWHQCEFKDIISTEPGFLHPDDQGEIVNCVKDYLKYPNNSRSPTYRSRLRRLEYYQDRVKELLAENSWDVIRGLEGWFKHQFGPRQRFAERIELDQYPDENELETYQKAFEDLIEALERTWQTAELLGTRNIPHTYAGRHHQITIALQGSSSRSTAFDQQLEAPARSRAPFFDDAQTESAYAQSVYEGDANSARASTRDRESPGLSQYQYSDYSTGTTDAASTLMASDGGFRSVATSGYQSRYSHEPAGSVISGRASRPSTRDDRSWR
jgi:hypothetical protein